MMHEFVVRLGISFFVAGCLDSLVDPQHPTILRMTLAGLLTTYGLDCATWLGKAFDKHVIVYDIPQSTPDEKKPL